MNGAATAVTLAGHVIHVILREPVLLAGLLVSPVLALFLVWPVRRGTSRTTWWGAWTSLGWVFTLTLYPTGVGLAQPATRECFSSLAEPRILGAGLEVYANIGLFVVLTTCWSLATRRPSVALAAGVALSAAIELTQSTGIGHSCSGQDWAANSLGALLGSAVVASVFMLLPPSPVRQTTPV